MSKLYHGGAPGFRPGELILPHPTRRMDGCPWCESGADDNHLPDRVFATASRIYARYYASKYILGTLYIVEPHEQMEGSDNDPFETYHAPEFRVQSVCERAVRLTNSERRQLFRMWKEEDDAIGRTVAPMVDLAVRQLIGRLR